MASKFLCEHAGYTQPEVAEMLKIGNGASVSKQLQKIFGLLTTDREAQRLHNLIENQLKLREGAGP